MRTHSSCLPIPQICDKVLIKKKEHEPYYRIQKKKKKKKENGMTGRESNYDKMITYAPVITKGKQIKPLVNRIKLFQ
jgi:hypothetical protein